MMDFTIQEIADACGGRLVVKGEGACGNACVSCVAVDSRLVERGGVFLATVGQRTDGHKFVSAVFEKGAALAVVCKSPEQVEAEYGVWALQWGSYVLVEDTLQALKDIAEAYRKKLAVKVVGITGSVGKTSTKEFIAGVLAEKYNVLKTEGNFNNEIGVPLTLLRIRPEHEVAVVEMGISDFGEMHRLSKMARPDICVITNIGQSHLNNLKDRDGILRAKSEIFDFMAQDGEIVLNGEDDKLLGLREKGVLPGGGRLQSAKLHYFGLGGSAGQEVFAAEITGKGLWGSDVLLRAAEGSFSVHVPLPGEHMVLNCAAAACVAGLLGVSREQIVSGIGKVEPVGGRANIISLPCYTLIDDCYNANPASMHAALELLALADTERIAILGDMLNLGENSHRYHEEIGMHAAELGIERLLCVGEESRYLFQAVDKTSDPALLPKLFHFPDADSLIQALAVDPAKYLPKGSTILLKASHDIGFARVLEFLKGSADA